MTQVRLHKNVLPLYTKAQTLYCLDSMRAVTLNKDMLDGFAAQSGGGTSLVTLAVQPGTDVALAMSRVRTESATAANIKCRV